jgi:phosphatidylserine decarboxylase
VVDLQHLIASDPVVGRYVNRMIAQVPETRSYTKRHLESPDQMLRLINEVLTMAPEFDIQNVTLPLGAIALWDGPLTSGNRHRRDAIIVTRSGGRANNSSTTMSASRSGCP